MITYVDTSTLFKLVVSEEGTTRAQGIWRSSESLVAVSLIEVEGAAAVARARRGGRISGAAILDCQVVLRSLLDELTMIEVTASLITSAVDVAERSGLRGYDAVHLATAALVDADVFSSADTELCDAAAALGMSVANPMD